MLTPRVLATLRATLLFWQEEMAVHSMEIARPYWDQSEFSPLTVAEIEPQAGVGQRLVCRLRSPTKRSAQHATVYGR